MTKKRLVRKNINIVRIVGVMLLFVVLLWSVLGVKANAAERAQNDRAEFRQQEVELKKEVKECLEKRGYYNSGITMTKVMDVDGSREYSIMIHHQDLDSSDMEETKLLHEELSFITMEGANITVNYTIF